jgi:hypothetical protein
VFLTLSESPDALPLLATSDPTIIRAVARLLVRRLTGDLPPVSLQPPKGSLSTRDDDPPRPALRTAWPERGDDEP